MQKNGSFSFGAKYKADVRRYDNDSVCQGAENHQLCPGCKRLRPGAKTGAHFISVPALNLAKCPCYRPGA